MDEYHLNMAGCGLTQINVVKVSEFAFHSFHRNATCLATAFEMNKKRRTFPGCLAAMIKITAF